ncbi:MAG: hypothetical protein WEC75_08975 [Dehalococcoidia bacterium]
MAVGPTVFVDVGCGVLVDVGTRVLVAVGCGVFVDVGCGVAVLVRVGVAVDVFVGIGVFVAVAVLVGVGLATVPFVIVAPGQVIDKPQFSASTLESKPNVMFSTPAASARKVIVASRPGSAVRSRSAFKIAAVQEMVASATPGVFGSSPTGAVMTKPPKHAQPDPSFNPPASSPSFASGLSFRAVPESFGPPHRIVPGSTGIAPSASHSGATLSAPS